jgi:hypothetical protein
LRNESLLVDPKSFPIAQEVHSNFKVAGVVSFSKSVYPNIADRFTLRCSDVTLDSNDLGSRIDDAKQDEREE